MARQILLYLLVRGSNGLLALASVSVLTRLLVPREYGLFALALATMNVLASVCFQWLTVSVGRLLATRRDELATFFVHVRQLHFISAAILIFGLAIWCLATSTENGQAVLIGGLMAVLLGTYTLHLQILNSVQLTRKYALLSNVRAFLAFTLASIFAFAGLGDAGALAGVALGIATAVLFFGYRWEKQLPSAAGDSSIRRQLTTFGLPLGFTYGAVMVLDFSDRFLISHWHGASAVAGYSASSELTTQSVGAFLNVFYLACYPRVALAWETGGLSAARRAIAPLARSIFFFAPAIGGTFICLGPDIAGFVVGQGLREETARIMPWAAAATTMMGVKSYLLDIALHLEKRAATLLRITILMASASIALNVILIPRVGPIGAAISSTVAYSLGAALSLVAGRRAEVLQHIGSSASKAAMVVLTMIAASSACGAVLPVLPSVATVAVKLSVTLFTFGVAALLFNLAESRQFLGRYAMTLSRAR